MNFTVDHLQNLLDAVAKQEGCDSQSALRDILTDLRHLADINGLNFHKANFGAEEEYLEEVTEEPHICEACQSNMVFGVIGTDPVETWICENPNCPKNKKVLKMFRVPYVWTACNVVEVMAYSREEAIDKAYDCSQTCQGEYLNDSLLIEPDDVEEVESPAPQN